MGSIDNKAKLIAELRALTRELDDCIDEMPTTREGLEKYSPVALHNALKNYHDFNDINKHLFGENCK